MKALNISLTVLFVLFAAVQYNDSDPYIWIPIYLFVAVICYYASKGTYNKKAILIGGIPITLYMIYYIPDFERWVRIGMPFIIGKMQAETPYIELMREFGGLALCVGVLAYQYSKTIVKKGLTDRQRELYEY